MVEWGGCSYGKRRFIQLFKGPKIKKWKKGCTDADVRKSKVAKSVDKGEVGNMDNLGCIMDIETRKKDYNQAKGAAKRAIFKTKMLRERSFVRIWEERIGRRMCSGSKAKQLVNKNRDVVGGSCQGQWWEIVDLQKEKLMDAWRAHYDETRW